MDRITHTYFKGGSDIFAAFTGADGVVHDGPIKSFKTNVIVLRRVNGACTNITILTDKGKIRKASAGRYEICGGKVVEFVHPNLAQLKAIHTQHNIREKG